MSIYDPLWLKAPRVTVCDGDLHAVSASIVIVGDHASGMATNTGISRGHVVGESDTVWGVQLWIPVPIALPIGFGLLMLQLIADLVAVILRIDTPFGLPEDA